MNETTDDAGRLLCGALETLVATTEARLRIGSAASDKESYRTRRLVGQVTRRRAPPAACSLTSCQVCAVRKDCQRPARMASRARVLVQKPPSQGEIAAISPLRVVVAQEAAWAGLEADLERAINSGNAVAKPKITLGCQRDLDDEWFSRV